MPVAAGPDSIETGLVLSLDAADRNSYPGSGTTWYDLSGNNNSGSLVNGPTFNTGSLGSIVFDGVNDYVNCGVTSQLTGLINISVSTWVFPISTNTTSYASRYSNITDTQGWVIISSVGTNSSKVKFNFDGRESSATYLSTNSTLEYDINTWYNITGTKSSNTWSIYVNGSLVGTNTVGLGNVPFATNNMQVGALIGASFSVFSPNRVSATQIYNRVLSSSEILQNYNAQKSRFGL